MGYLYGETNSSLTMYFISMDASWLIKIVGGKWHNSSGKDRSNGKVLDGEFYKKTLYE